MEFLAPHCLRSDDNVKSFSCGNESLDKWLAEDAYKNQQGGYIRIFASFYQHKPQIAGYCALTCSHISVYGNKQASLFAPAFVLPCVYLARLAVDKEAQNQGLGRSLLRFAMYKALDAAENIGLSLFITEPLAAAQNFYRYNGFCESGELCPGKILFYRSLKDIREDS